MVGGDGKGWVVAGQEAVLQGVGGVAGMGGVMNRNDKAGAPLLPVADAGWWDVWPR